MAIESFSFLTFLSAISIELDGTEMSGCYTILNNDNCRNERTGYWTLDDTFYCLLLYHCPLANVLLSYATCWAILGHFIPHTNYRWSEKVQYASYVLPVTSLRISWMKLITRNFFIPKNWIGPKWTKQHYLS